MNKLLCIFLIVSISGNVFAQEESEEFGFINKEKKYQVSIYSLVSNQEKFDGKPVYLAGYAGFYFDLFLFPDKASCMDAFLVNSIAVSLVSDQYEKIANKYKNCQQIIVFGEYNMLNTYGSEYSSNLLLGSITKTKVYDY